MPVRMAWVVWEPGVWLSRWVSLVVSIVLFFGLFGGRSSLLVGRGGCVRVGIVLFWLGRCCLGR